MLGILKECGQELPLMGAGSEDAHPNPYSFIISQTAVPRKSRGRVGCISVLEKISSLLVDSSSVR
jgi:hypothetical protein